MKGKNCVVTGGNAGIGFETAMALASKGANVIIISRSEQKATEAVEQIKSKTGNLQVEYVLADLSSQKSIRQAATEILARFAHIDVLVNNAGTWFSNLMLTEDNVERQFAVNHLAYFLLTHLLLGALSKAPESRIICVGSDSHFHGKINFEDLTLGKKYHGIKAYAQSKLANVMYIYELDKQLKKRGVQNISVYCVQPGLVKTDIGLKHTISLHGLAWKIRRLGGVSPAEGASTSIFLASSPDVGSESGKYWDKCKPKPSSKISYNQEDWFRLWKNCEEQCQIDDYFAFLKRPQV